jgi:DNA-binding IclR family transcriptional regulator
MRYKPSEWGVVALLMRDSTYRILEAVSKAPKAWTELVRASGLTEAGLSKALSELKRIRLIEEVEATSPAGAKVKKYAISKKAKKLKIYETAKSLKKKLELLSA